MATCRPNLLSPTTEQEAAIYSSSSWKLPIAFSNAVQYLSPTKDLVVLIQAVVLSHS
jgi:hypothetical protein